MELNISKDCKEIFFDIINLTRKYPEYNYTLNNHIIRTVVSIGSNIAGSQNKKDKEKNGYLDIAVGSCNELLFQVELYNNSNVIKLNDKINKVKATCLNLKKVV